MKILFCSILFLIVPLGYISAQVESDSTDLTYPAIMNMENAIVVQDSTITVLLQEKIAGVIHSEEEVSGWRVQIYSSNTPVKAKSEALNLENQLKDIIDQPIYIVSTPPFIKVRIGDFLTQEEAKAYKDIFIQKFPDMISETYIVRDDHIKVKR